LNQELQATQDSTAAASQELSSKVASLDELFVWEQAAQDALRAFAKEKRLLEQELRSTR
jgi:hypothetical protein